MEPVSFFILCVAIGVLALGHFIQADKIAILKKRVEIAKADVVYFSDKLLKEADELKYYMERSGENLKRFLDERREHSEEINRHRACHKEGAKLCATGKEVRQVEAIEKRAVKKKKAKNG